MKTRGVSVENDLTADLSARSRFEALFRARARILQGERRAVSRPTHQATYCRDAGNHMARRLTHGERADTCARRLD